MISVVNPAFAGMTNRVSETGTNYQLGGILKAEGFGDGKSVTKPSPSYA